MNAAFKEWAIVVDALGRGEQILILRKGGISEGKGGFQMEHSRFWLFPTLYHQQGTGVIESAQRRYQQIQSSLPTETSFPLQYFAAVEWWSPIADLATARRLQGQHIWTEQVIEDRFEWGREQKIFAIAVRVHQIPSALQLPMSPAYGGCKSWIQLEQDLSTEPSTPVLSDMLFQAKLSALRRALETKTDGL